MNFCQIRADLGWGRVMLPWPEEKCYRGCYHVLPRSLREPLALQFCASSFGAILCRWGGLSRVGSATVVLSHRFGCTHLSSWAVLASSVRLGWRPHNAQRLYQSNGLKYINLNTLLSTICANILASRRDDMYNRDSLLILFYHISIFFFALY